MKKQSIDELYGLINQLNKESELYIGKIKELIGENRKEASNNLISYFTYTINFSYDSKKDNLIISTYHLLNYGDIPLTNPHICIKFSPGHPFYFSGKILNKKTKIPMNVPDAWERINSNEEKEEYWLKPLENSVINPGEKISFSNFQLKWQSQSPFTAAVHGYAYSDEIKDGSAALNQINIIVSGKEEGHQE